MASLLASIFEPRAKVFSILDANRDKDFISRILDPRNSPFIENDDGSISTHRMATAEADGTYYVYPTILRDQEGGLQRHKPKEAFKLALKTGEVLAFKSAKEADWFERNWKTIWGHKPRGDK